METEFCPRDPQVLVSRIRADKMSRLAQWAGVSLLMTAMLLFAVWKMIESYMVWRADTRRTRIRVRGRDNISDADDDFYDPYPDRKDRRVPSKRTIEQRMRNLKVSRDVLDSKKDRYERKDPKERMAGPWNQSAQGGSPWNQSAQGGSPWNQSAQGGSPWNQSAQGMGPMNRTAQGMGPMNQTSQGMGPMNQSAQVAGASAFSASSSASNPPLQQGQTQPAECNAAS